MQVKVGIGILVVQDGKILMSKRLSGSGTGTYGLPGGKLEYMESIADGTARELFEETGLIMKKMIRGPIKEVISEENKEHFIDFFNIVTEFGGILENKEPEKHSPWQWYALDNLPTPLFYPMKLLDLNTVFQQTYYLSAPYNDPDPRLRQERYDMITKAAGQLIKEKKFVFSPITHNIPIRNLGELTTWDDWRDYDLSMLALCGQMILLKLPGWEKSRGVSAEIAYAKEKNLPIVEMNTEALV